jgi:hypothetical protein
MWEKGLGAEPVLPEDVRSFTEAARLRSGKICGEIQPEHPDSRLRSIERVEQP